MKLKFYPYLSYPAFFQVFVRLRKNLSTYNLGLTLFLISSRLYLLYHRSNINFSFSSSLIFWITLFSFQSTNIEFVFLFLFKTVFNIQLLVCKSRCDLYTEKWTKILILNYMKFLSFWMSNLRFVHSKINSTQFLDRP